MKKIFCILFTIHCSLFTAFAQDLHFSQFYESPLTLNPALCGQYKGDLYGEINYRNQWSSVLGGYAYSTMDATLEFRDHIKWNRGYVAEGLSFFSDNSGNAQLGATEIAFTLASGVLLNANNSLSAGLQAGWGQRSVNFSNMQWGEQYVAGVYNPDAPTGETSIGTSLSYMDYSGGLSYNYSSGTVGVISNDEFKINLGASIFHFNQPNISYYGANTAGSFLYMRYAFHGYLQYGLKRTHVSVIPGFVYYMQGPSQEIDAGLKVRYYMIKNEAAFKKSEKGSNAFDLGAYYRFNDAVIILLGMKLKSYTIGFSYDINISQLDAVSSGRGAFELSLKYIN